MSVVVTGATGHLGRLVLDSLLARGVAPTDITAAGRRTETLSDYAAKGINVVAVDYNDPATLEGAFTGADAVLLISSSAIGQRVAQHSAVLDAVKASGAGRIVYTSAFPGLVVSPEHEVTEAAIKDSGVPFTILRNGWYIENYQGLVDQARATGGIIGAAGEGKVAGATRADLADAAAVVLTSAGHEGKTYGLTGDTAFTYTDLAAALGGIVGREVTYTDMSVERYTEALIGAGLDEGTAGFLAAADQNIRDGLMAEVTSDLSDLIGRPTQSLKQGLTA
ncbi:NAD(P)H-binding protein [Jonesia quinghaiensis]|uniref:NAD(P)H-binding protein n=1 Tax=Jonesia quinghaiensis TaxID=262806 RepID=UPI000410EEAC|nr:NAD(P)H-binding protein [Jonesia quinghaiensis]